MTEKHREIPEPAPCYDENRRNFPQEELAKYAGQYIAFSLDGTRILAGGEDMEEVEKKLVAMGINPAAVVGSYVFPPDVTCLL